MVLGAGLGQSGFAACAIYAGSFANGQIYQVPSSGAPTLFATVPMGAVGRILFDPGSSFGGKMIVATTTGDIYTVTSTGVVHFVASVGDFSEGMDIATRAWGPYAGDLLVGSEHSGTIRLVSPSGTVTVVGSVGSFPGAETVNFVPLNLNPSDP